MNEIGRFLIIFGIVMILLGVFFIFIPKFNFFKLPGDIYYRRENFLFYFPITTSIIISILLTLILNFIKKN
jgi:hypothetical protein